ncbi:MAG: OsmC family protein [Candidatus Baltobacteraceae bacterium]
MNVRPAAREHHYATRLEWTGARDGPTRSYAAYSRAHRITFEGKPPLEGSADPAFRGDPHFYIPEELLLASLSACHMLTYLAVCALAGIVVASYADDATGTMTETGGVGRFSRVVLRPRVTVASGDLEHARALHDQAHRDCFIASSVNFPVEHEPDVRLADLRA